MCNVFYAMDEKQINGMSEKSIQEKLRKLSFLGKINDIPIAKQMECNKNIAVKKLKSKIKSEMMNQHKIKKKNLNSLAFIFHIPKISENSILQVLSVFQVRI